VVVSGVSCKASEPERTSCIESSLACSIDLWEVGSCVEVAGRSKPEGLRANGDIMRVDHKAYVVPSTTISLTITEYSAEGTH